MKKTLAIAAVFAALALLGARVLRSQAPDPLDPLRVAPDTHKLAFENAFVRVLDVHVPPGKTEPRHRHPHGLSVYFTDWDVKVTIDGASPRRVSARPAPSRGATPSSTRSRTSAGRKDMSCASSSSSSFPRSRAALRSRRTDRAL